MSQSKIQTPSAADRRSTLPRPQTIRLLLMINLLVALSVGWSTSSTTDHRTNSFAGLGGSTSSGNAKSLRITSITPSGDDVTSIRQIVFQFDRQVVAIGRMERDASEVPITISPKPQCEWRWISTSALACQLGSDTALQRATRYSIRVLAGIEALDGSTLEDEVYHQFGTVRPKVRRARFRSWQGPGSPRLEISLDQPVHQSSLDRHLYYTTGDRSQRFAIRSTPKYPDRAAHGRYAWLIDPVEELPLDSSIQLRIEPGLAAYSGPEAGTENRVVVEFATFPEFEFLGVRCTSNRGEAVVFAPGQETPDEHCNPLQTVALLFSSPVTNDVLSKGLEITPDLAGGRTDYDPWANAYSYSRLRWMRKAGQTYALDLPEVLRAKTTYQLRAAAAELPDEFGRTLSDDIELEIATDDRPPRLVLTHPTTVLEHQVETHVPVVVTNLESLTTEIRALTPAGRTTLTETMDIPEAKNIAFRWPLPVREWLDGSSGAVLGQVKSSPATSTDRSWFFTQVTPFQVHAKLGHRSSLVWVTDLATGEAIEGARVRVYRDTAGSLLANPEVLTEGQTDGRGLVTLAGTAEIDPQLTSSGDLEVPWPPNNETPLLFVRVDAADGEMALLPLGYSFHVRPTGPDTWDISNWQRQQYGHMRSWGTTAQGIYRLGDTIRYKIYVRDQGNRHFTNPTRSEYTLLVYDPMGKEVLRREKITLNEFGALDGELPIPETGAVGWYEFELSADFTNDAWTPMRVLVADFTPAPFRVTADLNGTQFDIGETLAVTTSARLHSGGPYSDAESRITAVLSPTPIRSDQPAAEGFFFESGQYSRETIHQSQATVDSAGDLTTEFVIPETVILHGRLRIESAVRDDRGKYIAGSSAADFVARDRFIGLRQDDWLLRSGEVARLSTLVIDNHGEIVGGTPVRTVVKYRKTTASRVKGAGNAYLTQYNHEWIDFATCEDPHEEASAGSCEFTPDQPGRYRFVSSITDTRGRSHSTSLDRWASGAGQVLWEAPPGHHLPIEAEKSEYQVGDTARFLVRNPFPGATALVTTERFGVIESWTRTLDTSTEVVEIEVTPDHLPGFYLSVVVTSPRIEPPLDDSKGTVDLGKPAFRIGYVEVPVRDRANELEVRISTDKPQYRPRETVTLDLQAVLPEHIEARDQHPPIEIAVAVLDESVFDLISGGRANFDPYEAFYSMEPLDLENYNLLTRLIGIQKFEKKGANAGGGGSSGPDLRSLFDFVSYWNPSITTDADSKSARVTFDLPDNLTGWRVLAMAVSPDELMGLSESTFTVNQPIEIRPALPNQVTAGDRFTARFTVMNRTDSTTELDIEATVSGPADSPGIKGKKIVAEPYKRYDIEVPVVALGAGELEFEITAIDSTADPRTDDAPGDALRVPLTVHKLVALHAAATYGTTTGDAVTEQIEVPADSRDDVGRLSVIATPTVIGNIDGAFTYLRDYPYSCWEQKLTKGVMASHYQRLEPYLSDDLEWANAEQITRQTLELAANHQAPNGGMTYWTPRDAYVSPYLSAYTALAFGWLRDHGHQIPAQVEKNLHDYLRNLLRNEVFPEFYSKGMASSVRSVALAALAKTGSVTLDDLSRYRRHVPQMDLFGRAHYLLAATQLDAARGIRDDLRNDLLSHSNQSGGKIVFTETVDTGYQRILHTPLRTSCAILSALVEDQGPAPEAGAGIGDLPFKLVRTISQSRQRSDRWENTQENLFCMNALIDYSRVYEAKEPRFTVSATLDDQPLGELTFDDRRDPAGELERPIDASDIGVRKTLTINRQGEGRLYYSARLFYSPKELSRTAVNAGIEVHREYSVERDGEWQLLGDPIEIQQGELVRVDLYVSLPAARNFVVIDDPVPGGLEAVNRELATASTIDADKASNSRSGLSFWFSRDEWLSYGWSRWSFNHRELRHHAVRYYSEYLPAGNYHLSYTAQAIAPGEFQVLPTHSEEMYDPDVFGKGAGATLIVEPSQ